MASPHHRLARLEAAAERVIDPPLSMLSDAELDARILDAFDELQSIDPDAATELRLNPLVASILAEKE